MVNEENPRRKGWMSREAAMRHGAALMVWAAVTFFTGGIAWQSLKAQADQTGAMAKENKIKIETLDTKLDTVHVNQRVIQEKLKSAEKAREEMQESLDRILSEVRRPRN